MRIVDLRWIMPLPVDDMLREANATGRVLVVDETRHSGGVGEGIVASLVERGFTGRIRRVASMDSYVPARRRGQSCCSARTTSNAPPAGFLSDAGRRGGRPPVEWRVIG